MAYVGMVLWAIYLFVGGFIDLRSFQWSTALLLFAALVLVPLVLDLVEVETAVERTGTLLRLVQLLQLPAALGLVAACLQNSGWLALALAMPWVMLTGVTAILGIRRVWRRGLRSGVPPCQEVGLIYFSVGGAWVAADRLGMQPLGFSADIVQLTAVHFHYAGLVLPVLAGCILQRFPANRLARWAGWGILAGIPLVAIGITGAQLGVGQAGEAVAAIVLGSSGCVLAGFQLVLVVESKVQRATRVLWTIGSLAFVFGMTLAVLYGMRSVAMPLAWLDIPWMRALHGTANALGFCFLGLVGWSIAPRMAQGVTGDADGC